MKYKVHITTEAGELLNTIEIDTEEMNWETAHSKSETAHEIYDEIYRHMKYSD